MSGDQSIRFFEWQESRDDRRLSKLLDAAFAVEKYTLSFPHIFTANSSAQILVACDKNNSIVAACTVDTEIWSSPRFLRGACIGSVAVAPDRQRQGFGKALLRNVLAKLQADKCHDFAYLFSDQHEFYGSLGFKAAGREKLYSHRAGHVSGSSGERFIAPTKTSELSAGQAKHIWQALERFRKPCESHASLGKLEMVLKIPDMLVCGFETAQGEWTAGAFIGKGVDFSGVVHSFFAKDDSTLKRMWSCFTAHAAERSVELQVAPGAWSSGLKNDLSETHQQALCMVRPLTEAADGVCDLIDSCQLYPRSLFSS
ncbi:MAG: GNAT family N-acetyltransferase [Silvanigrellaceae bacterium]